MLKIIDLTRGEIVIQELDEEFVEAEFLQHIAVEYEEELPELFWLSPDAIEGLLSDKEIKFSQDEGVMADTGDPIDTQEIYISDKNIGEEMKKVLGNLLDYLSNYSEFIDADGNDLVDPNEKGCYLAFEYIEENPEYKLYGKAGNMPGIRIQLYDMETMGDDLVGFGFTDPEGNYSIEFNRENFSKDPLDFKGIPDLYMIISELDKEEGEFKEIKRVKIGQCAENITEFDVEL